MATRRVSQRDAFARPRPPRKSGRTSSPKDQDDPPPYDSPPSSSSEGSDLSLPGVAAAKNASTGAHSSEAPLDGEYWFSWDVKAVLIVTCRRTR